LPLILIRWLMSHAAARYWLISYADALILLLPLAADFID
jgi:hypothetical protein